MPPLKQLVRCCLLSNLLYQSLWGTENRGLPTSLPEDPLEEVIIDFPTLQQPVCRGGVCFFTDFQDKQVLQSPAYNNFQFSDEEEPVDING